MKKFNLFLAIVPVCVAVVCAVYFWYEYELVAIALYFAMIFALPFASFMHELGHMLFGAIVGIKAVPKFSIFGSSCCKIIPKTDKRLKSKVFFTTMGGIFVNVAFIILGVVAMCVEACPMWLAVFMPSSIWLYIINILPFKYSSGKTDGLILTELVKNDDEAKVLLAVLTVQAQVLKGKPIAEVDKKLLFDQPQIVEDDPAFIAITELRYEYYKAVGEEEKANLYKARFEDLKKEYM